MDGGLGISEFAERCGLSVSALRFYDRRGLLQPAAADPSTGYRVYSESQIVAGRLVRDLRQLEMPLGEVTRMLGLPAAQQRRVLDAHIESLNRRLRTAARRAGDLRASLTEGDPEMSVTIDAQVLAAGLDQVLPAVGEDPERPILGCVLLEAKDGSLRLVATDSFRLAVRDLAVPDGVDGEFQAVVPAAAVRRIRAGLAEGPATVGVDDLHLTVSGPGGDQTAALLRAEYPTYERLLGTESAAHVITVGRDQLIKAMSGSGDVERLRLGLRAGELVVDIPAGPVRLDASYSGDGVDLVINPRFVLFAAEASVGPEIVIEANEPLKPVLFRSADDGTFVCLVMPIKP